MQALTPSHMPQDAPNTARPRPVMRLVTPGEIADDERRDAEERQTKPEIIGLASDVMRKWQAAYSAKTGTVEGEILGDIRRRQGEYEPKQLAEIRKLGADYFFKMTDVKCRDVESWIQDILAGKERPWTLEPTPEPELPPAVQAEVMRQLQAEVMMAVQASGVPFDPAMLQARQDEITDEVKSRMSEEANLRAERMADTMDDMLVEGEFYECMPAFLYWLSTTKAAFLKGPIFRNKRKLQWVDGPTGFEAEIKEEVSMYFTVPNPLDIYPSPGSSFVQDGYLCERHRMTRSQLAELRGVPGYDSEAIDRVLIEEKTGGLVNWLTSDSTRADLEQKHEWLRNEEDLIDSLEYWGSASGKHLAEWGLEVEDEAQEYQVHVWLIGNVVIKATLNPDLLSRRPYSKASYIERPGSFWGEGAGWTFKELQQSCNAIGRALVNNAAIASGPQVGVVDSDRIINSDSTLQIYPWKVWHFEPDRSTSDSRPPITFFQPELRARELIEIYQFYSELADDYSGIPKYSHGDPGATGAATTASGLSMLLGQASKGMKSVIARIDTKVIVPSLTLVYEWTMLNTDDDTIKGDLKVQPLGAQALMLKEQQTVRRTEFLQATNNPVDYGIMGPEKRANLLRKVAESLDIESDELVPKKEDMMQQTIPSPDGGQVPVPQGQTIDAAGQPVAGQDYNLSQQP